MSAASIATALNGQAGSFVANVTTPDSNVTGDATVYQVVYDTETGAQDWASLATGTGLVTISEAGLYYAHASCRVTGLGGLADWSEAFFEVSGSPQTRAGVESDNESTMTPAHSEMFSLSANDTIAFKIRIGGTGGLLNGDVDVSTVQTFLKITRIF